MVTPPGDTIALAASAGAGAKSTLRCSGRRIVAVGIRLTPYPPHRSVRADFPHTALASGSDAQTARGIRMADMGRRKPASDEPCHSVPLDATVLASSAQGTMPEVAHGETKVVHGALLQ